MTDERTTKVTNKTKHFSGMIGLRPAFGDTENVSSRRVVNAVWKKWAMYRHSQKKPHVGIMVGYSEDLLVAEDSASSLESDSSTLVFSDEPMVSVKGELHAAHDELSDEEMIETLKSLFCHIGRALKQTQVKFTYYGNENYVCKYNIRYPERENSSRRSYDDC